LVSQYLGEGTEYKLNENWVKKAAKVSLLDQELKLVFFGTRVFKGLLVVLVLAVALAVLVLGGCRSVRQFPDRPIRVQMTSDGSKVLFFDIDGNRLADYWQREDDSGRKVELCFDGENSVVNEKVLLDEMGDEEVPHFIIALDGVPYQLVRELYGQGCLRLFYPPSRMISSFPAMTDVAFQRVFGGHQPRAYQATYFDRQKNRLIGGNDIYMSGEAADWAKKLDYRCSFKLDAIAYKCPEMVFEHELRGMMEVFRKAESGTKIAYSVATAGLGTQGGREAILKYLRTIDQLCEQIVYERHGRVKITLLADHGHNMSGRGRISFKQLLAENGYRLTDRLKKPGDVVTIEYGLITYAEFFTDDPAGVGEVLLQDPAVTIACFPEKREDPSSIVVQSIDGKAFIRRSADRYSYTVHEGDPLQLSDIIERLREAGKVDETGFIDDRAMFEATVRHIYPDPLRRVWMAFNGLVEKPADLIVCLKDGWVHGSAFFEVMIGGATSTHGSLNQINSTTFAMTMWGPLPEAMRLEDLMVELEELQKRGWRQDCGSEEPEVKFF